MYINKHFRLTHSSLLLPLAAFVLLCAVILVAPMRAEAATVPTISYSQDTSRSLIFVNNPEQITTADLGDNPTGAAISSFPLAAGNYRNFFEHVNTTGSTIGYGVRLYNNSGSQLNVTIYGAGYTLDSNGGVAFSNLFNNYNSTGSVYPLAPNASMWIIGGDGPNLVGNSSASIPAGNFFSGAVDFSIDGTALVNNIAYQSLSNIAASTTYEGLVTRGDQNNCTIGTQGCTDEARVYKGISQSSLVTADVNLGIDGSEQLNTPLPVSYATYNLASGSYNAPTTSNNGWVTNIGPGQNANAITSDMVSFTTAEGGTLNPLTQSDSEGKYPNLANWGVVYTLNGSVTNTDSNDHRMAVNLSNTTNQHVVYAYQGSDGVWRSGTINPGGTAQIYTFTVPANSQNPVSFTPSFVLGGPSAGSITQSITVLS